MTPEQLKAELETRTNSLKAIGESYAPLILERNRLKAEIERAKILLAEAPLMEHDEGLGNTCEVCAWQDRMNAWYEENTQEEV